MNEALIAAVASELVAKGHIKGKKAFQKLFYLLDSAGVPTGLDFKMHFYGPYSFELAEEMNDLVRLGVLKVTDGDVEAGESAVQAKELFAEEVKPYADRIEAILRTYRDRSPNDLELLATTHFVTTRLRRLDTNAVIAAVKDEKAKKFDQNRIEAALKELNDTGLLKANVVD